MLKQSLLLALKTNRSLLLAGLIAYVVLVVFMPNFGHAWDCACWGMWSTRMNSQGIASAYTEGSTVNYLPLYLYVLRAYGWLVGTEKIFPYIYTLKVVTLLFDVASAIIIASYVKDHKRPWRYVIFALVNIGFIYNTYYWNQVDGILTFFILAAFVLADKGHISWSMICYLLALNFKLQGIIFLPIIGMMWLYRFNWKGVLLGLIGMIITQVIILIPFIKAGVVTNIGDVIFGSVDYYKSISMNAFNFWYLIMNGDLMFVKDNTNFILGMTQKQFGLLVFLIASACICIPLLFQTYKKLRNNNAQKIDTEQWLRAMLLVVLIFFFFNTQMHERYVHPAIAFSTLLAFKYKQYPQWIFISLAYALSLESICKYLQLNNYGTLIFHPKFIAGLYLIGMVLLVRIKKGIGFRQ